MRAAYQNRIYGFRSLPRVAIALVLFAMLILQPISALAAESITIPVEVAFSGSGLPDETFRIELADESGASTVQEITLTNNVRSGKLTFTLDASSTEGVYTLREIAGSAEGVKYSDASYRLRLRFDENGNAAVTAIDSAGKESKPGSLRFDNSYTGGGTAFGDPPVPVQKKIAGDRPAEPETFVFYMVPDDPSYPLQEGAEDGKMQLTITGEGEAEFGIIAFTKAGVYRYSVYEEAGSANGWTYDDAVYTVIYTVTEGNGGALVCDRRIIKGADISNVCVFTNRYTESDDPKSDDPKQDDPKPDDPKPDDPKPDDPKPDNPKPSSPGDDPKLGNPKNSPKTGDSISRALYGSILAASVSAAFCLFSIRRKNKKEQ